MSAVGRGDSFPEARIEHLAELMAFVDGECERAGVPEDAAFAIRLAAEEAFTNVVRHGYGEQPGPVRFELSVDGGSLTLTLIDEAPVFDPRAAPAADLESSLEDRGEGGLGWHLVHQLMDEVRHEPGAGRGNVLRLIKYLGDTDED